MPLREINVNPAARHAVPREAPASCSRFWRTASYLFLLFATSSWGATHNFTVDINAFNEVPTNSSPGTGIGTVTFDDVSNMLNWNISWTNATGPATGIHFHGPAGPGTNAGVRVNIGAISGLSSPTIGSTTISSAFGAELLANLWYVNIHTAANVPGEIRGQVLLDVPPLALSLGTIGTGETVTVQFDVVINEPFPAGTTSVMNQATIQGDNFAPVLTDDPDTPMTGDATVTSLPPDLDFGDASSPYPTLLADDGARHVVPFSTPVVFLGMMVDDETNGFPSVNADGDDLDQVDDEDGVLLPGTLVRDTVVDVQVTASAAGLLNAWVDFDTNGVWDVTDQIFTDEPLVAGVNNLNFAVPATVTDSVSYARFRFDSGGGLMPTGLAADGEVEDYLVTFITAETTVEIVGNDLVITDVVSGGKDDTLLITLDAGELVVVDTNNALTSATATIVDADEIRAAATSISGDIQFDLIEGDDEVVVDFSGGDLGVDVLVNAGAGTDVVVVAGTAGDDEFAVSETAVTGSLSSVTVTNNETMIVAGADGDDLYSAEEGWGVVELVELAGGGSDTVDLSSVSVPLTVVANSLTITDGVGNVLFHADQEIEAVWTGSGGDKVFVQALSNSLSIATADSTDTFEIGESNSLDGVTGPLMLDGGAGFDFLNLNDQDDADADAYAMSGNALQRGAASPLVHTNIEFLTLNTTNDGLSGQIGDGSGGELISAKVNLAGTVDISGNLVLESDGRINIDSSVILTGAGAITNRGAMTADGDVSFPQSVFLEGGGTIVAPSGSVFTVQGDFGHGSGNPTFDLLHGGIILPAGNAHDLSANSVDQGALLAGYTAVNRPIGGLQVDDQVDVFGTVYVWELSGSGDITVQDGAVLYYVSDANWTGTATTVGSGRFEQVFVGFDAMSRDVMTNVVLGWPAAPGLIWQVETTDELVSGVWVNATGFVGTATSESWTDEGASGETNRYYRLQVRP